MPTRWTERGQWAAYLLLAALALSSSGCLAAVIGGTAAAGAATGVMYVKAPVSRTYQANPDDVWAATHTALAEMDMAVKAEERTIHGGSLKTRTTTEPVEITLEVKDSKIPSEGPLTTVGVRIGTFGDEMVSNRILEQINLHLIPASRVARPPVSNLGALKRSPSVPDR